MASSKAGPLMARLHAKPIIKRLFRALTWPLYALYCLTARISDPDASFASFSQFLSLFPGKTGSYLRAAFYSQACPNTSDEIVVGFLTLLSHRDTTIQRGVYIGPQCNIGKCTIGEDTLIGSGVHILSGNRQHNFDDPDTPIQQQGGYFEKITIGRDCWIGNSATVMADVGSHSIVAAATVVTKVIRQFAIVAGQPARIIKNRDKPEATN
ncbi:acyltransferase [Marinobacter sp. S6332]|uniref:acyltransferase n=1 Tax=Marinobacter sp. S6332 TaxID=2926403 RepID=UPI001FF456EB|nr:acyltransferase [Marinobacter sp. S6332]MCK0163991.1 acyltransferase [Marinobacter sp. S6332]